MITKIVVFVLVFVVMLFAGLVFDAPAVVAGISDKSLLITIAVFAILSGAATKVITD